ncbi:ATP-dependent DNA helicase DDX11 [Aphidius gifuensis]|uniref:ATP-dependent DNA helicase DDX11 n=1 Tax=Aphidius gifuensis TaxID=684658 RepID=UPI001CDB5AFB|nr:ATP-dependent DNA helicase DDX11 [Aphidius gifuensis]
MEPEEFEFPFPPYPIQIDFMKNLWKCLNEGKLGIFESPTGTGKSLSIICGALKWLVDYEENNKSNLQIQMKQLNDELKKITDESKGDWFVEQTGQMKIKQKQQIIKDQLDALERHNKLDEDDSLEKNDIDQDLLLEDLNINSDDDKDEEEEELETARYTQFFFCSRTHSQLTQFIGELKNSPYADKVSSVPLSSRQNYCINKTVKKLKHVNLINERNQSLLIADIVTKIQDIEEIGSNAKELETCAYYASRRSLPDSQVILLPYNTILHANTRKSSGINLKNNVIIIDEAHNLLEAIERMHSSQITGRNILHCYNQLTQYQKRFENLFSAKSVLSLSQLSYCLKKLIKILGGTSRSQLTDEIKDEIPSKVFNIEDFEAVAEIDTINIFHLIDFINQSKLIHKLQGFVEKYSDDLKVQNIPKKAEGISAFLNSLQGKDEQLNTEIIIEQKKEEEISNNPLILIISFLESLKSCSSDGRIFVIPGKTVGQGVIKFLLMNPAAHFHDIVKEAKSVILAGGTMEPISEFRDQLFIGAGAESERIMTFSCDHVVPKENILTRILCKGPTGVSLEFNYQNRQNPKLLDELGRILQNLCNIIPGGMVVFLPSYGYEEHLSKHLEKSGVLAKIKIKKKIYREPKTASGVNAVLEGFARDVKSPKIPQTGALLFSVVGGKLSEGLNFSDDLGRCVIVVGMPYPNIKSPELQEKIKYLNENLKPGAGNEYYENSCMKAVNQCIGRAVRHINDYSTNTRGSQ